MDHANIYLIIAGSYTPFAMLAMPPQQGSTLLWIVWVGAAVGVFFRVFWLAAPGWLYTALYVVVGWVAVFFVPELIEGAGPLVVALVFAGGLLYTMGAVVYALKRPNPSPDWFGFHELFHSFTMAGYLSHFVAIWIVVHA
jgi:hemolysin III